MNTEHNTLTIQQVAAATGLTEHTLRYYERIGLIHPISRAGNTHRRYSQGDIGWIDFLTKLRSTGMSIQQMTAYAELQRQGDETLPERLDMLRAHRLEVEAHIEALRQHMNVVGWKIAIYEEILMTTSVPTP